MLFRLFLRTSIAYSRDAYSFPILARVDDRQKFLKLDNIETEFIFWIWAHDQNKQSRARVGDSINRVGSGLRKQLPVESSSV